MFKALQNSLLAFLLLLVTASVPTVAQIDGGDYGVDTEEKSESEIIYEYKMLLKILDVKGFEPMKTDCMQNKITKSAVEKAGKILKRLIEELPDGYFIEVMGHADKVGADQKMKSGESLNDYLSRKRAESVALYLVKSYKISAQRLRVGGAGDAADERKVTFRIRKVD